MILKSGGAHANTMAAIARAGGVSIDWLVNGTGDPDVVVELDERYPSRAEAARFARANGFPEEAIREVLEIALDSDSDPGGDYWYEEIRQAVRRAKGKGPKPMKVTDI